MKKFLAVLGLTLSITAHANTVETVFDKDSKVPTDLQARILNYVNTKCSAVIANYGLNEVSTSVRLDRIDQGVVDQYFTTTFSSRYYFDGMHPTTIYFTVESAVYAFQNGDNLEVLKSDCE